MQIYKNNLIEITQNGKNVNAVVNMPFRFTAKNSTSLDSFRKDLENNLRYDVWVMLELTKTIGLALSDSDVDKEHISQQLVLLGELGATYAETLDLLQITFNNLENNIDTTQALQFAGESLEPTTREVLAEEISAFLESSTAEENHSLLEALDELSNRTYADFPLSHIKQLFIDADSTDFLDFQSALENIKNPVVKEVLPVKSFSQQVLNFLQNKNTPENQKQSLIDFIGYEMNEADISVIDESVLPSSLVAFAESVKPEWLQDFKETALKIIGGEMAWTLEAEHRSFDNAMLAKKVIERLNNDGTEKGIKGCEYVEKWCKEKGVSATSYDVMPSALVILLAEMSDAEKAEFDKNFSAIFETEEKPLNLSEVPAPKENECIDLAKSISCILTSGETPTELKQAIGQFIDEQSFPQEIRDSPEYIQKVLETCKSEQ